MKRLADTIFALLPTINTKYNIKQPIFLLAPMLVSSNHKINYQAIYFSSFFGDGTMQCRPHYAYQLGILSPFLFARVLYLSHYCAEFVFI